MSSQSKSLQNHIFEGKIKEYEHQIIEFFIEMGELKDATKKSQIIKAYLLIHDGLTQKQLRELTGFSNGSISSYLNALVSIGMCEKRLIRGTHTYKYSFAGELSQILSRSSGVALQFYSKFIKFLNEKLKELRERGNPNKKGYKILSMRLKELLNFFLIIDKVIEMLKGNVEPEKGLELLEIKENLATSEIEEFNPEIKEIEDYMIDFFLKSPILAGKKRMDLIISNYFITRKYLTQRTLRKLTGFSAGMISQELKDLLNKGLIEKKSVSDTGQITYSMERVDGAYMKLFSKMINETLKWENIFVEMKKNLDNNEDKLKEFNGYDKVYNFLEFYIPFIEIFKKSFEFYEKLENEINKNSSL